VTSEPTIILTVCTACMTVQPVCSYRSCGMLQDKWGIYKDIISN